MPKKFYALLALVLATIACNWSDFVPPAAPVIEPSPLPTFAIPTVTSTPTEIPSPTPLPTNTIPPLELPTQSSLLVQPTASPAGAVDLCSDPKHIIPGDAGPSTTIKIVNEHKSSATVSIYLNQTVFGECGYRSYSLGKNGSTVQTLPQGCYSAWAWGQDPKDSFNAAGYGLCVNNSDKWTMVIRGEKIIMLPP